MRGGPIHVRKILVASLIVLLPSCVAGALQEFGSSGCRTVYVFSGGIVQPVNSCGGVPRDALRGQLAVSSNSNLAALLAAPKFEPDAYYTGVDTPEDKAPLTKAINDAVRDILAMPESRDATRVRQRLQSAIMAVDEFATEDREHAYMYLVLAWRAAGFTGETGFFASDEQVLGVL